MRIVANRVGQRGKAVVRTVLPFWPQTEETGCRSSTIERLGQPFYLPAPRLEGD